MKIRIVLLLFLAGTVTACGPAAQGAMDRTFIYFPQRELHATPAEAGLSYREVDFEASDGVRLHGWFVPGEAEAPAVLFFHGNAGNIAHRIENLRLLRERLGVSTFIFDYRGYGRSTGEPSEEGTYADARGALGWLRDQGWPPERLIYFGRSLGSAVALQLALEAPPSGVVLESPFPSIAALGRRHYPILHTLLGWSVRARYDNLAKIDRIGSPLLFIQGGRDAIVPEEMARELFERAPQPKTFHLIPEAGHNDTVHLGGSGYWDAWRNFLGQVAPGRNPSEAKAP